MGKCVDRIFSFYPSHLIPQYDFFSPSEKC
uniref:Uncharacterized protein n=1 Tax=Anguilla anguilla TaxID=7936 RepID=A0A0E9P6R2_ANGAN